MAAAVVPLPALMHHLGVPGLQSRHRGTLAARALAMPDPSHAVTLILHLPPGTDPGAAFQLLRADTRVADDASGVVADRKHLFGLGQGLALEPAASGMTIWSQDTRLLNRLANTAVTTEQEFNVEVSGQLAPRGLELLKHGLSYGSRVLPPMQVSWQNEVRLRFAVKGLQRGQIHHVCQEVGLTVIAIKRLRVGRVSMGKLPVGRWRYLGPYERF